MALKFGADRQLVKVVADCDTNIAGKYNNGKKFAKKGEEFFVLLDSHLADSCRFKEGKGRTSRVNADVADIATTVVASKPEPEAVVEEVVEEEKKPKKWKKSED